MFECLQHYLMKRSLCKSEKKSPPSRRRKLYVRFEFIPKLSNHQTFQFTLKRSIYLLQYGLYDLQQQKDNVSGGAPPRRGHPLLCALRHDILSAWSQLGVGVEQAADEVDQPLRVGGGGRVVGRSHRVLADSFPPQDVVALVEQVAASVAPEGQDAAK